MLFSFLDEGKRELLTPSNCRLEGLPEGLKLLLSSIFHQIKSKKRTYNIEKFINEGHEVLKVKK